MSWHELTPHSGLPSRSDPTGRPPYVEPPAWSTDRGRRGDFNPKYMRPLARPLRHRVGRASRVLGTEAARPPKGLSPPGGLPAVGRRQGRQRCEAMLPRVDIGDLILEVMTWHPPAPRGGFPRPAQPRRPRPLQPHIRTRLTTGSPNRAARRVPSRPNCCQRRNRAWIGDAAAWIWWCWQAWAWRRDSPGWSRIRDH